MVSDTFELEADVCYVVVVYNFCCIIYDSGKKSTVAFSESWLFCFGPNDPVAA